jgi:hypothetical protein
MSLISTPPASGLSGLSQTVPTGSPLRVSPLQRCGLRCLAASYTTLRLLRMGFQAQWNRKPR